MFPLSDGDWSYRITMRLMVVESPNKAKKIKGLLPPGWVVQGSGGHIRDLPDREIGVEAPNFKPKYVISSKSQGKVKQLKDLAAKADYVVLATDLDREGEAIAWHLQEVLKLKNPDRITFNEVTKKAILTAIDAPRKIDINLVAAQEARRVIDRIVGYTVSPAISACSPTGESLSAGRVQSVAVRIVVDREREISNFTAINHYEVIAKFNSNGVVWTAKWDHRFHCKQKGLDDKYWLDKSVAESFAQSVQLSPAFKVRATERKRSERKAPAAFTTSTLQQAASASLNIPPENCMRLAQSLFEAGLISYHRTDSPNLSDEAIADVRKFILKIEAEKGVKGLVPSKPNVWKGKADAQEAHEAIRPTDINNTTPADISGDELRLYTLIHQRTVACQMSNAVYDKVRIALISSAKLEGRSQPFLASAQVLIFPGWTILTPEDTAQETAEDAEKPEDKIPNLSDNQIVSASGSEVKDKETKPPARYTEAGLIKKMEAEGVGRPSTYAAILATIKRKQYVKVQKKVLKPEKVGEVVRDMLVDSKFAFVEVGYTRQLEMYLDEIAKGKIRYRPLVAQVYDSLTADIARFKGLKQFSVPVHQCPQCKQGNLKRHKSKHAKSQFYWRCDNYDGCTASFPDKKVSGDMPEPDLNAKPKGKVKDSGLICPKCNSATFVMRQKDKRVFWSCSGFPKCKTSIGGDENAPDPKQYEDLVQTHGEAEQAS